MKASMLFLIASAALAQTPSAELMSGTAGLRSGVVVHFKTVVEPPLSQSETSSFSGGISPSGDMVHRIVWDDSTYFGYDVAVTPGAVAGTFQVSFQPLSVASSQLSGKANLLAAQLSFPAPETVHDGDTIALNLFVSPDGTHRIVDYIQIRSNPRKAPGNPVAPRDFTLDDGPIKFDTVPTTTVWINGQKFDGGWTFTGKPGATFWIHFPGRPMYILSLAPAQGSERAGTVRDNVLAFQADGQQYAIHFNSAIAGVGRTFNLYLLRNPDYQPKAELANGVVAGVDRLENLLPER